MSAATLDDNMSQAITYAGNLIAASLHANRDAPPADLTRFQADLTTLVVTHADALPHTVRQAANLLFQSLHTADQGTHTDHPRQGVNTLVSAGMSSVLDRLDNSARDWGAPQVARADERLIGRWLTNQAFKVRQRLTQGVCRVNSRVDRRASLVRRHQIVVVGHPIPPALHGLVTRHVARALTASRGWLQRRGHPPTRPGWRVGGFGGRSMTTYQVMPALADDTAYRGISADQKLSVLLTPSALIRRYFGITVLYDGGMAYGSAQDIAASRIEHWLRGNHVDPTSLSWSSKKHQRLCATKTGWIYFIRDEAGYIKIGYATNVSYRMNALQTASRQKLTLLARVPGSTLDEKALHRRFRAARVRGEWFRPTPELRAYISEVVS